MGIFDMEFTVKISDDQIDQLATIVAQKVLNGLNGLNHKKVEVPILTKEMLDGYGENSLHTRSDIMNALSISNRTVTNYIQKGILNPLKSGKKYYFTDEDVTYLKSIISVKMDR